MKALKYVVAVVSAFLLLSMSALAADGDVVITPNFSGSSSRFQYWYSGAYATIPHTFNGAVGTASVLSKDFTLPDRSDSSTSTWLRWIVSNDSSPYLKSLTSGVLYSIRFDFTWAGLAYNSSVSHPFRLMISDSHGTTSQFINPDPGSAVIGVSGGSCTFSFAIQPPTTTPLFDNLSRFNLFLFDNNASSSLFRLAINECTITYAPTTQSVIDEITAQGNLIQGAINEQTGQITGKIDEVTDEILHGYVAPDFSGNQSTIDDYNNKEHELIDGTADGKNEMESINNNALSAITSHVGAFVSVAQMMNDFINGHWFTNGLFTISASVGLLAVLLGVGIFAVGRFSARQHSDARYEARRADRRRGRGR